MTGTLPVLLAMALFRGEIGQRCPACALRGPGIVLSATASPGVTCVAQDDPVVRPMGHEGQ